MVRVAHQVPCAFANCYGFRTLTTCGKSSFMMKPSLALLAHWQLSNRRKNLNSFHMSSDLKEKSFDKATTTEQSNPQVNEQTNGTPPRYGVAAVYAGFLAYAFFFAPGSPTEGELLKILSGKINDVNDIFFAIFCLLGAIPLNFAALLNPGACKQKRVKPEPFVLVSLATGFIALGPYLIARDYVNQVSAEQVAQRGTLSRILESKWLALVNIVYSLWSYAFAFGVFTPGNDDFRDSVFYATWVNLTRLFSSDRGVCVSCIDFVVLSLLTWGPLTEDMKRRGWFRPGRQAESLITAFLFVSIPAIGPAMYLLLRPQLPNQKPQTSVNPS